MVQQRMQQYKKYRKTDKAVKRILIINAETDVSLALKLALEDKEYGYFKVNSFNDPISALKNFENGFYDLVIIDIVMSNMNGFELSEKIRKMDDNVKVCFLTAGEVPGKLRFDSFIEGLDTLYGDRFIRLPIENEELVWHVDRIIHS